MSDRETIERFLAWLQEREKEGASVVRIKDARHHFTGSWAPPRASVKWPS